MVEYQDQFDSDYYVPWDVFLKVYRMQEKDIEDKIKYWTNKRDFLNKAFEEAKSKAQRFGR